MKTSIIIPFYNEEETIDEVVDELRATRGSIDEYIFVDDGSTDRTAATLASHTWARLVKLPRNMGQSAAIYAGLMHAQGDVLVTLDGDGQNDPADISTLVRLTSEFDFVIGYRKTRRDTSSRKVASRLANALRSHCLRDGVRDSGCGLKAFRKHVLMAFIPFNGLHRFMPALAINAGFSVTECPVNHRPRKGGTSKYGNFERGLRGAQDLWGVKWMLRRAVYPTVTMDLKK